MIVTINTDASFSKKHEKGSFAFWIVCNEFKILKSGLLRKKVTRPEQAEFKCIINALHTLFNEDCDHITKIIINTDCLNVIHLTTGNKEAVQRYQLGSWGRHLVSTLDSLRSKHPKMYSVPIEYRHVKAHNGSPDARSYVNEWCDANAKAKLREYILS